MRAIAVTTGAWIDALSDALDEFWGKPVIWGKWDCCQFVGLYDYLVTGDDKRKRFPYESEMGADRILAKAGGFPNLFRELFGDPVSFFEMMPGDIVLCDIGTDAGEHIAAGVFAGYCVFLVHPERGLSRTTVDTIRAAYKCRKV